MAKQKLNAGLAAYNAARKLKTVNTRLPKPKPPKKPKAKKPKKPQKKKPIKTGDSQNRYHGEMSAGRGKSRAPKSRSAKRSIKKSAASRGGSSYHAAGQASSPQETNRAETLTSRGVKTKGGYLY